VCDLLLGATDQTLIPLYYVTVCEVVSEGRERFVPIIVKPPTFSCLIRQSNFYSWSDSYKESHVFSRVGFAHRTRNTASDAWVSKVCLSEAWRVFGSGFVAAHFRLYRWRTKKSFSKKRYGRRCVAVSKPFHRMTLRRAKNKLAFSILLTATNSVRCPGWCFYREVIGSTWPQGSSVYRKGAANEP